MTLSLLTCSLNQTIIGDNRKLIGLTMLQLLPEREAVR
jgi:hypothetical protein